MDALVADTRTLLIIGPTFSGRRRLLHQLLGESSGRPILISTREPATNVRSRYQRVTDAEKCTPVVIDCITNSLGRAKDETETTKYAQDPGNLTSVGMKFSVLLEQHRNDDLTVGLTNLSPLLVYSSPSEVFQFLHVVVQQSTGNDWPVVASIDPGIHETATVEQFVPLFDRVIETRRTGDGDHEFRGRNSGDMDWKSF